MVTSYPGQRISTAGVNPFRFLLLASAILAVVAISIAWQRHAEEGAHAADTASVRQCLENKGPYQIWKDRSEADKFYLLCQMDDERWGFSIITKEGNQWSELTSFVRGNGGWRETIDYLSKWATRFTGTVPGL